MNIANLVSDVLVELGESGNDIINAAFNDHSKIAFSEFMCACSGCNGDWVEIVISGIERLYPEVFSVLPTSLLKQGSLEILTKVLILCGVEF